MPPLPTIRTYRSSAPPGFADTPELLSDLDRRGIAVFGSDLWAGDWIAMSADHERERVMTLLENRPHHNGIILFHDTRPSPADMLPAFLADLGPPPRSPARRSSRR